MTNEEWLVDQCQRLKYGECHSMVCLRRGGYEGIRGTWNTDCATCHAYEIHQELKTQLDHPINTNPL